MIDKLIFETKTGTLEVDINGRFQMGNRPNYVSARLKPDEINELIKFLQNRNANKGWKP